MTEKKPPANSLQDHMKAQWEKYLTANELARIFKASKINIANIVEIKSSQIVNNKEFTAKIHIKTHGDDKKTENNTALVSFRLGPPTWDQFLRTTYRSGSNIGIRIIIHEGTGFNRDSLDEPTSNAESIDILVYNNNNCGLKTYLIEAKGLIQRIFEGKTRQVTYNYETGPTVNDNLPALLPSIRQVQEAEFWTCYYLPAWGESSDILIGFAENGQEWAKVFNDLSLPVIWNDGGLHINVFGDVNSQLVKLIWDNKRGAIQEKYPEARIELLENSGEPYGISIRILELPMNNLIKLGVRKKIDYAEFVRDAEHNFVHVIDDILADLKVTGKLHQS